MDTCGPSGWTQPDRGQAMRRFEALRGPSNPRSCVCTRPITGVYSAHKVWLALKREGIAVARCTVGRLMADLLGLTGAVWGKARRITIADPTAPRPADLVQLRFAPSAPNRLWVQLRCVQLKAIPCSENIVASCVDVAPQRICPRARCLRGQRSSNARWGAPERRHVIRILMCAHQFSSIGDGRRFGR